MVMSTEFFYQHEQKDLALAVVEFRAKISVQQSDLISSPHHVSMSYRASNATVFRMRILRPVTGWTRSLSKSGISDDGSARYEPE